jgi:hypothetical protein
MFTKGELLNKYAYNEDGQLFEIETGEIIAKKKYRKAIEEHVSEKFEEVYSASIELGEKLDLVLSKDKRGNNYSSMKVKEEYEFVKVFTVSKREVKKSNNLSKISKAAWFDLEEEIHFPTNTIVISGKSPSMEDLCEYLDLKKSKLYEVLKELENADLIKREKINGQIVIYVNPYLFNRGFVDYDTIQMFKGSGYNPTNRK